jgi:hypothetical protein
MRCRPHTRCAFLAVYDDDAGSWRSGVGSGQNTSFNLFFVPYLFPAGLGERAFLALAEEI